MIGCICVIEAGVVVRTDDYCMWHSKRPGVRVDWCVNIHTGVVHAITTACKGKDGFYPLNSRQAHLAKRGCRICGLDWKR